MSAEVLSQIQRLISIGHQLLNGLQTALGQVDAPGQAISRDLFTEGAGYLAKEVFGAGKAKTYGRKLAKGYLEQQRQQVGSDVFSQYEVQYRNWLNQVEVLLRTVSIHRPGLTHPGNSQLLIRRIRRAAKYKKLETKINHVTVELQCLTAEELVLNSQLPRLVRKQIAKPSSKANPYEILRNLETKLRQFIEVQLGSQSPNWWQGRVPDEVRANAERRKSRSESVWPWHTAGQDLPLICFVDFSDYKKIILRDDNWANIFRKFFGQKAVIEARLVELEPIRNDIAHTRDLSEPALDKLLRYSQEIITWIDRKG